jgi:hypothetical protein
MLGAHSQIFGCGELSKIYKKNDVTCTCGKLRPECPVWSNFSWQDSIYKIYQELPSITDKPHIVDSTKKVDWLKITKARNDIFIIHLKRNPLGVFNSMQKNHDIGVKGFAKKWKLAEQRIKAVKNRENSITIKYEDLILYPERTLTAVLQRIQLKFEPQMLNFKSAEQHQIGGNGHRFDKTEDLKLDVDYKERLSLKQKLLIKLLTGTY